MIVQLAATGVDPAPQDQYDGYHFGSGTRAGRNEPAMFGRVTAKIAYTMPYQAATLTVEAGTDTEALRAAADWLDSTGGGDYDIETLRFDEPPAEGRVLLRITLLRQAGEVTTHFHEM